MFNASLVTVWRKIQSEMGLALSECKIFVPSLRTNNLGKQNFSISTKFHYVVM